MILNLLLSCIAVVFILMLITILNIKNKLDLFLKRTNKNYFISSALVIGIVFIVLAFFAPKIFLSDFVSESNFFSQDTGYIGDTIGGLTNPFIAIAGVSFTFLAFYMQKLANDDIKNQFKLQQFENQFFEMLRLHKENVNEMKITGYDTTIEETISSRKKVLQTTRSNTVKLIEGRKVFVSMVVELTTCYEFLELINSNWNITYDKKDLLKLSYRIFFFGSNSQFVTSAVIDDDFIDKVKIELRRYRKKHRDSSSRINEFQGLNKKIKLYIKYSPFTGHESRLGHYYRHLYHMAKFVVDREKDGYFDYNKSREYLKIVRAQMSNDEQLMLYYNYIIGFGADWDFRGNSGNQFFTKYRMLHNLPTLKVNYADDPRVHFKEYIKSIKKGEGDLFEWGDF